MGDNTAFLQEFRENMDKLSQINANADKNVQFRKELSNKILTRLGEINSKLQEIVGKIRELKSMADNLQNEVNKHTKDIGDKSGEINAIKAEIQRLNDENKKLTEENAFLQQKCKEEIDAKQQENMAIQQQIRELIEKNKVLEDSVTALQNELSGKGENEAKHASELAVLNEEHKKQIENLMQENKQQIEKLMNDLAQKEQEIANLNAEIKKMQDEQQSRNDSLAKSESEANQRIAELLGQIEALKNVNDDLIQRLKEANTAILSALGKLDELSNPANFKEDDEKLDTAITEIEKSLMEINTAIQGRTSLPGASSVESKISGNEIINITGIGGNPVKISYRDLVGQLSSKASIPNINPKYGDALKEIRRVNNVSDIETILQSRGIDFKQGKVFGGRKTRKVRKTKKNIKTRKVRKQKGGFYYKTNSKRKSLRSSIIKGNKRTVKTF
jgi:DNA repair exonuclease SbcCD ATPase subunit